MGAGLYFKSRPDVDPKRIGMLGRQLRRLPYRACACPAPLTSSQPASTCMASTIGTLEMPTFSRDYDPREHVETARLAFESSPMASVKTWRSPVLLIHGDDDRNVPFAETVQLVEALRRQKVDFEELIFPDEIHDFLLHRDWVRAYSAALDFLQRKLTVIPQVAIDR